MANMMGAAAYIKAPMTPIVAMPKAIHIHESRFVRSKRFAPIDCPTSVVAASAIPKPGM